MNVSLNLSCHSSGNANTTNVDFFDSSFTFYNESIQVSCCGRDNRVTIKTCGLGASCIGQCSAIEASLCLSGNCTGDLDDCRLGQEEENQNRKKRSSATGSASDYRWCYPACMVAKHPSCCYNPTCKSIRPKLCKDLKLFTGIYMWTVPQLYSNNNFPGNSCPKPGSIPHGNWSCQMQELPIPDVTILDGGANTFPGE